MILEFFLANYFVIALTLTTALGAAGMYVFSDFKGFENSKSFLRKQFPKRGAVFYHRVDFLLMVFVGTIVGSICFAPESYLEALAAGFGWTGAMNVLMKGV